MILDRKIPLEESKKIFFTSDTHFSHEQIIKFCNRPFSNVDEMDECLITRWNEKVPHDGLVFHLGDFAWGNYKNWCRIRERLNGNIILILGNHDMKNSPLSKKQFGELFTEYHQQFFMRVTGESGKRYVCLNHYPMLCYAGTYRNDDAKVYQLFGHVHMTHANPKGLDTRLIVDNCWPSQYDVGVDFNDFQPLSWDEVDAKIRNQIKNKVNLSQEITFDTKNHEVLQNDQEQRAT